MHLNRPILAKALAILISGILALQFIPVTFNGTTVIIQISCCKNLKDCCSSGVLGCTAHRKSGRTGAYTRCQSSSHTSVYMMIVSKWILSGATQLPSGFAAAYFLPFNKVFNSQNLLDQLFRPPQIFL